MSRILITGCPRAGKTTYAQKLARETGYSMRSTDDLIGHHAWSEVSDVIASEWLTQPGPWIVEGVAVPRAIRKWLASHPEGLPCDRLLARWMPYQGQELTKGQTAMAKGMVSVWNEIYGELIRRGLDLMEGF